MGIEFTGDWKISMNLTNKAAFLFPKAADTALRRIAIKAEGDIRSKIKGGPPPPQSKLTQATGGKGVPLNRDGDLGSAVNVVRAGYAQYFIGIPRSAGRYNLAVIHERGAVVSQTMTDRMRRFLHANLRDIGPPPNRGAGVIVSQIPARAFVEPVFEAIKAEFPKLFRRQFAAALGFKYGRP